MGATRGFGVLGFEVVVEVEVLEGAVVAATAEANDGEVAVERDAARVAHTCSGSGVGW
jgi:hypothetical protein